MRFCNYIENEEFVSKLILEFETSPMGSQHDVSDKPWSATKSEIISMWKKMRPDVPIIITPMIEKGDGGTQSYGEDGIRITGSFNFISSILGKLKELISHENPQTKLRLVLREIDKKRDSRADRNSYVFYLNLEKRGKGRPGRPKGNFGLTAPNLPNVPVLKTVKGI